MPRNRKHKSPLTPKVIAAGKNDRREGDRAPVDLFMNRFMDGHPYLCMAVDLSRTGMRLRPLSGPMTTPPFMGLQFQLPGSDDVFTASGERVRADQDGIAVRFTHMPSHVQAAIDRYLQVA